MKGRSLKVLVVEAVQPGKSLAARPILLAGRVIAVGFGKGLPADGCFAVRRQTFAETYRYDPARQQYRPRGKGFAGLDRFIDKNF